MPTQVADLPGTRMPEANPAATTSNNPHRPNPKGELPVPPSVQCRTRHPRTPSQIRRSEDTGPVLPVIAVSRADRICLPAVLKRTVSATNRLRGRCVGEGHRWRMGMRIVRIEMEGIGFSPSWNSVSIVVWINSRGLVAMNPVRELSLMNR
ncbi:hypothetical protein N658DRAFT_44590 [Parathielavia hyrcaniae]|uniref:Uncharacterized protein n=1 Tax=Parathielavia hyrcaniae TaxID=113614 RepID=A0AAN6T2V5_9PEZI|nr:hypothetical protein N658DRAFT_44590 [Parathielavia hyrcaniae]